MYRFDYTSGRDLYADGKSDCRFQTLCGIKGGCTDAGTVFDYPDADYIYSGIDNMVTELPVRIIDDDSKIWRNSNILSDVTVFLYAKYGVEKILPMGKNTNGIIVSMFAVNGKQYCRYTNIGVLTPKVWRYESSFAIETYICAKQGITHSEKRWSSLERFQGSVRKNRNEQFDR